MGLSMKNSNTTLANRSKRGLVKTTSTITDITGYSPTPIINGIPYYKDDAYTEDDDNVIFTKNVLAEGNRICANNFHANSSFAIGDNVIDTLTIYNNYFEYLVNAQLNLRYTIYLPSAGGTLALTSDIPDNIVTTDTAELLRKSGKVYNSTVAPFDRGMIDITRANKTAFLSSSYITWEYSIDGGDSFTKDGKYEGRKSGYISELFINNRNTSYNILYNNTDSDNLIQDINCQERITIKFNGSGIWTRICTIDTFFCYMNCKGAKVSVDIEYCTYNDQDTWISLVSQILLTDGFNEIFFNMVDMKGTGDYGYKIRLLFKLTKLGSDTSKLISLSDIRFFGLDANQTNYTYTPFMALNGHMYKWDSSENTYFVSDVYVPNKKNSYYNYKLISQYSLRYDYDVSNLRKGNNTNGCAIIPYMEGNYPFLITSDNIDKKYLLLMIPYESDNTIYYFDYMEFDLNIINPFNNKIKINISGRLNTTAEESYTHYTEWDKLFIHCTEYYPYCEAVNYAESEDFGNQTIIYGFYNTRYNVMLSASVNGIPSLTSEREITRSWLYFAIPVVDSLCLDTDSMIYLSNFIIKAQYDRNISDFVKRWVRIYMVDDISEKLTEEKYILNKNEINFNEFYNVDSSDVITK